MSATPTVQTARVDDPPFVLPDTVSFRPAMDVSYRDRSLRLDLFLPKERRGEPVPGLIFIHGGGWRGGTSKQFWRHAARLASHLGWPGICVTYRFAPEHRFPAQLEDVRDALRWFRTQAAEYGVDPERIGTVGGSAGGHLAALLGTTEDVRDGISAKVQAVVACNGVFDLETHLTQSATGAVQGLTGGDPEVARDASPVTHVDVSSAPMLLLHGTADVTVPFDQAERMRRRLQEAGVRAELRPAKGAAHGYFNRPPHYQSVLDEMERFLAEVLGG
jgi:acetyl esterase/lipase